MEENWLVEDREASRVEKNQEGAPRGKSDQRGINAVLHSARFPRRYSDEQDNFKQTLIGSVTGQVTSEQCFPAVSYLFSF